MKRRREKKSAYETSRPAHRDSVRDWIYLKIPWPYSKPTMNKQIKRNMKLIV